MTLFYGVLEPASGRLDFVIAGHNMRMNEIEACLGIVQMRRIDDMIAGRRRIAAMYDELLSGVEEVTPLAVPPTDTQALGDRFGPEHV